LALPFIGRRLAFGSVQHLNLEENPSMAKNKSVWRQRCSRNGESTQKPANDKAAAAGEHFFSSAAPVSFAIREKYDALHRYKHRGAAPTAVTFHSLPAVSFTSRRLPYRLATSTGITGYSNFPAGSSLLSS
jgi:hypothetical protein